MTIVVMRIVLSFALAGCAAATPLTDLGQDMISVPRSEAARVNEVLDELQQANDTMLRELVDLRRERRFLKAKLGCA